MDIFRPYLIPNLFVSESGYSKFDIVSVKLYIYDVNIQLYLIYYSRHYPYLNPKLIRNIKINIISIISVHIQYTIRVVVECIIINHLFRDTNINIIVYKLGQRK